MPLRYMLTSSNLSICVHDVRTEIGIQVLWQEFHGWWLILRPVRVVAHSHVIVSYRQGTEYQ